MSYHYQGGGGEQCAQDFQHGGSHHASLRPQWRGDFFHWTNLIWSLQLFIQSLNFFPTIDLKDPTPHHPQNSSTICPVFYWINKPTVQVYTGKFHPSGDILASSGFDRQIFLWKVYGEQRYLMNSASDYNNHRRVWECVSDERPHWSSCSTQVLSWWGHHLHCQHRQDGFDFNLVELK